MDFQCVLRLIGSVGMDASPEPCLRTKWNHGAVDAGQDRSGGVDAPYQERYRS
jgi:hypothetical protein